MWENVLLNTSTTSIKHACHPAQRLQTMLQTFTWTITLTCVSIGASQGSMLIITQGIAILSVQMGCGLITRQEDVLPNVLRLLISMGIWKCAISHAPNLTLIRIYLLKIPLGNVCFSVPTALMLTSTTDVAWMSALSSSMHTQTFQWLLCITSVFKCVQRDFMLQISPSLVFLFAILELMAKMLQTSAWKPVRLELTQMTF